MKLGVYLFIRVLRVCMKKKNLWQPMQRCQLNKAGLNYYQTHIKKTHP